MTPELAGAFQSVAAVILTLASAETVKWIKTRKARNKFAEDVTRILASISSNKESIDTIKKDIKTIKSEVTFNGGASLKDTVYAMKWESDARFLSHLNLSPVPTYICDEDGQCIMVNTALCKLFGLSYQEMTGYGWLKAIGKDQAERDSTHAAWQYSVKNDVPYDMEYTVTNQQTQKKTHCRSSAHALRTPTGEVLHYLGTVEILNPSN